MWKQDVDWLLRPGGNSYRSLGGFKQQTLILPQLRGQNLESVLLAFGGDAGFWDLKLHASSLLLLAGHPPLSVFL